ncbi:MAG: glycosyltransferase family 4 protein [Myxococcales bacterium]|nr:glycosyltransferase family 4 protein [Myxococcales bacterium]
MTAPAVYYFCFDREQPLGGPKQIYRHVELLNASGLRAYVVHRRRRSPLGWFEHEAPMLRFAEFQRRFRPRLDVAVLPEDMVTEPFGKRMLDSPGRKVIFNQNVYLGFRALEHRVPSPYPYLHPNVAATFAVSEHNARFLRFAYPAARVIRVRNGVDPSRFQFRRMSEKEPWIACASKAHGALFTLYHLLRSRQSRGRGLPDEFRFALVQGFSETQVAELIGRAAILLFLSTEEGFGLLPLEAMLSGCLVAAFAGGPMDEYLPGESRHPQGDLLGVARTIERWARAFSSGQRETLQKMAERGQAVAQRYSPARERQSVIDAWRKVLGPSSASAARVAGKVEAPGRRDRRPRRESAQRTQATTCTSRLSNRC